MLKAQNYCITISYQPKINPNKVRITTSFVIKAADVNKDQALKVASILFPYFYNINVVSIENDELTLTYEDYETLHMMVNDKLLNSMKDTKTTYENVTHPIDVKYKKLLEKMTARIAQFQHFCC